MNQNRREYERRVYRVVDYIGKHPTDQLTLQQLARIAAFSPYHFHRVFKSITGETLYGLSQRLRIEKGAQALLTSANRSIMEIAQQCGFASAATFARAFKAHFKMTSTAWRAGGYRQWREWRKDHRSNAALSKASKAYTPSGRDNARRMKAAKFDVKIKSLPSYHIACMRYVGPYGQRGIPQLWNKLRAWMAVNNLRLEASMAVGLVYDNQNIAASQTCRYDACVVVPMDFVTDRQVTVAHTASGRYAVSPFTGTADEIADVWDRTFSAWLPYNGYEPDDKPCIELYRGTTGLDPRVGAFSCELCLPIRRL